MLVLVLAFYSFGSLYVMRSCTRAMLHIGTFAGAAAFVANVAGAVFGGSARALFALPILAICSRAASRAFNMADDLQRDTDEEKSATHAGMGLVALAVGEGLILLVFAFVWLIARSG